MHRQSTRASLRPLAATVATPVAALGASPAHIRTWRAGLDALWMAIEATGGSGVAVNDGTAPGDRSGDRSAGSGGRGTQFRGPERDDAEQARIAALVELAQQGDREAFAQLYDAYVDTVFRYVYVRIGQRSLAEDLTSETFIRAMRRIDTFTWQGKDIAAWFVTIARNLIADHVKSARFRFEVTTADMRDADERVDAPDTEVLTRLRDDRLVSAIKELGPDQAECIALRFLQGLSLADTAKVLGKSEGAIKQLQLRATRALRKALEGVEL